MLTCSAACICCCSYSGSCSFLVSHFRLFAFVFFFCQFIYYLYISLVHMFCLFCIKWFCIFCEIIRTPMLNVGSNFLRKSETLGPIIWYLMCVIWKYVIHVSGELLLFVGSNSLSSLTLLDIHFIEWVLKLLPFLWKDFHNMNHHLHRTGWALELRWIYVEPWWNLITRNYCMEVSNKQICLMFLNFNRFIMLPDSRCMLFVLFCHVIQDDVSNM